jgi:O-antigen/teichoic acid export membrane protein
MIKFRLKSVLARNTLWMFVGQGLRLVIQALYFVEIARSLGARNYGAFVGVVALVGIMYPFGDFGSGNLLVKNVSRNKRLFATYWGRALTTTAATSSGLFVGVLLLAHFLLPATIPLTLVLLVAASDLVGLNIIAICGQSFQAFDRLHWTAAINILISASRLIGASVLIAFNHHPSPLDWGYIYFCSTAGVAAIACILVISKLGSPRFNLLRSAAEFREGFYFSAGLSAQTIYNDIDKTMLVRLGTLEATGIYAAAYRLIDVCFVPVSSLLYASYSNFFRAGAGGIGACLAYAKPLLLRALGYAVFACLALLLCAGAVPYVLGSGYAKTAEALRWLAVLPALKVIHYFFSNALTGAGYQAWRTLIQVGVAVFNVLINLWLIPLYSWRGAAWSSVASDALLACGVATAVFVIARRTSVILSDAKVEANPWSTNAPLVGSLAPSAVSDPD